MEKEKVAAKKRRRAAAAAVDGDSKEDRISKLPEEILSHILSSFDLKSAAKTCALSKAWRYVWCNSPRLLFYEDEKKTSLSLSVLDKILQSYHDLNLRLEEFYLRMSSKEDPAPLLNKWVPILIHDMGLTSLELRFMNRRVKEFDVPSSSSILESDNIQNLSLQRCKLETQVRVDLKRLQTLYLCHVFIPEVILDNILSNCPFLENVSLSYCWGFKRIKLTNNNNKLTKLAHFYFREAADVGIEIGNDVQTLGTIHIEKCLFSVSHNKPLEFARLTRLSLTRVKLSSESFLCNLHSLEELKLDQCSGIKEFKLSSRSMKRLSINNPFQTPFKATIDAPSIVSFNYEGILPQSISCATSSDDHLWKSKINLGTSSDEPSRCFNELYGLLEALSQSEISLELDQIEIRRLFIQLPIEDINYIVGVIEPKQQLPVAVEHLTIRRPEINLHASAAPFLKKLFHMFRPSFIYMGTSMMNNSNKDSNKEYRGIAELLFEESKRAQSDFWQRVLEGVSLQVKYRNQNEWQSVEYTSFTEVSKKGADGELELRIQLKWRD